MRITLCMTTAVVLAAMAAPAVAKPTAFQLKTTTWSFVDDGKKLRESVDADGKYITQTVAGKHVDHGTSAMKDGKACFTSAMTKAGEICWAVKPVAIGHSIVAVSDKGMKLRVTRMKYRPMSMPK